jgi:O-acetylhomoserine/O-acetylserine sulfhydrylase-like pyridoxal-dependent enzyme
MAQGPTCRVVRCAPSNQCLNLTQNSWVSYPGLPDHPYHAIAVKQFRKDTFGGVLSFGVKGDPEVGAKVVDNLKLASNLANVGDAKTVRVQTHL